MEQNELMHYGVLGMKWGKRKGRNDSVASKKKPSRSKRTVIKNLSVNSVVNSKQTSRGRKAVKVALGVAGGLAATAAVLPGAYLGWKVVRGMMDMTD